MNKTEINQEMPDWKVEIRRRLTNLRLTPTRENAIIEELAEHRVLAVTRRDREPSFAYPPLMSHIFFTEALNEICDSI